MTGPGRGGRQRDVRRDRRPATAEAPTARIPASATPSSAARSRSRPRTCELRHSAASLLSAAGVPLEEVADVLGHASTRVTSQTYRHATTPTVEAGAAPMERLFGPAVDDDSVIPVATSLATGGDAVILRGSRHRL